MEPRIRIYFEGFENLLYPKPPTPWRLVKWCIPPGTLIEAGTVVAILEDDGMVLEHEVFQAGTLEPLIEEGQEVRAHDQIAWLKVTPQEFERFLRDALHRTITLRLSDEEFQKLESIRGEASLEQTAARVFRVGLAQEQ